MEGWTPARSTSPKSVVQDLLCGNFAEEAPYYREKGPRGKSGWSTGGAFLVLGLGVALHLPRIGITDTHTSLRNCNLSCTKTLQFINVGVCDLVAFVS